ncbi:MAG: hypothetical protein ACREYF_24055 [Gammaproteobacteria bacterium]
MTAVSDGELVREIYRRIKGDSRGNDVTKDKGKKITFFGSSEKDGTRTSGAETARIVPARWTFYLLAVPAFAAVALLAALFFAAFLALFAIAGVGLGLWFWWVRWRMRKVAGARTLDGDYVVIEETQIIEKKKDGAD